mmetsp:Transcript_119560/g.343476  ORF Transcript_119560/g.343476 Transcript_119560/m.343476 type:complete len:207 (-) Transcript_119560:23-643(-)
MPNRRDSSAHASAASPSSEPAASTRQRHVIAAASASNKSRAASNNDAETSQKDSASRKAPSICSPSPTAAASVTKPLTWAASADGTCSASQARRCRSTSSANLFRAEARRMSRKSAVERRKAFNCRRCGSMRIRIRCPSAQPSGKTKSTSSPSAPIARIRPPATGPGGTVNMKLSPSTTSPRPSHGPPWKSLLRADSIVPWRLGLL